MNNWNYKVEVLRGESELENEKKLKDMGNEGWELVNVFPSPPDGRKVYLAFLKKPTS